MNHTEFNDLTKALGVTLPDDLLVLALTHRSYAYEQGGLPTNERLEFLGDSVLGLVITDELYHRYPDSPEGTLAKLRASLVNTSALAQIARTLTPQGLGVYMFLGRGELRSGGTDKSSILADGMESLLGAIYLHHGIHQVKKVILSLFRELFDQVATLGAGLDWKTSLQELTALHGLGAPNYHITQTGPDHNPRFDAIAVIEMTTYGTGIGKTKKAAEQNAAENAWKKLNELHTHSVSHPTSPDTHDNRT